MAVNIYNMADSWTDGSTYTAIKMNVTDTSSNAASLLLDLQVAGASKFSVSKAGNVLVPTTAFVQFGGTSASFPAVGKSGLGNFLGAFSADGSAYATFGAGIFEGQNIILSSNASIQFTNSTSHPFSAGTGDTAISRSAAGILGTTGGLIIFSGTAVPAGGTAGSGYRFSSVSNLGMFFGSGVPTLAAAQGSIYLRTDGSTIATRLYVNTDGGTTWTNFVSAA